MKRFSLILLLLCSAMLTRAQLMGIKSNMVKDALCVPNVAFEVALADKITLNTEFEGGWSLYGVNRQRIVGAAPEVRWWLGGRTFHGIFLGGGAKYMHYNFEFKNEFRRGDAGAAGITLGYNRYYKKRISLEFSVGFGAMLYAHQHWFAGDKDIPLEYREKGIRWIPYQTGVTLVYLVPVRPMK